MSLQLQIKVNGQTETSVPLSDGDHLLGRSRSADIQLTQPDVSGKHLMLHVDGNSVIAENLSSHGSRVGQDSIELPTPIRIGDSIYLGKKTVLTLLSEQDVEQASCAEMTMMTIGGVMPEPEKKTMAPASADDPDVTIIGAPAPVRPPVPPASADDPDVTIIGTPADNQKTVIPEDDPDVTIIGAPADNQKTVIPDEDDPDVTVIGTPAGDIKTVVPDSASQSDSEKKKDNDVFKTNVMQTRIASAEELEFLRRQDRKSKRGRTLKYIIPVAAAAVILGLFFFLKGKAPEEKLTWPLDSAGKYSEKPFDLGDGGFAAGRFSLIAPLTDKTEKSIDKNGNLVILTKIGRDRDVTLRLVLSSKRSPKYLHQSRDKTFREWIQEISASGGHWNFDRISDLFFIGRNNGLPCMSAAYTREIDNQSWYGEVIFFRNGDERVIRMAEIPNSERLRGADFLSNNPFLFTSPNFVEEHWEGADEIFSGDPADLLQEAKSLLVKMSPATWDKIFMLLRSALVQSTEKNLPDLKNDALNQLRKLRANQKIWYNAQMIAYLKEKGAGNTRGAEMIRDSCLAVFSSNDDLRHRNIQRNIWE